MKRIFFTFIFTLIFTFFCTGVFAAEIRFKSPVQSEESTVLLKDIADIIPIEGENVSSLGEISLFPAPIAGGVRIVRSVQVRDLLANHGISSLDHTFTGAEQISIKGPQRGDLIVKREKRARTVDAKLSRSVEEELAEALRTYLNRCTGDGRPENAIPWEISISLNSEQVKTIAEGGLILGMYGGSNPLVGRQEFQVELEGINPGTGRRTLVRFFAEIAVPPRVLVAKRALPRNKVLNENDVQIEYRRDLKGTDYFTDPRDVLGKSVLRDIKAGSILASGMVQNPLLVKKGEIVAVYARTGGIEVRSTAKALEDGARGDLISLEQQLKPKAERGRPQARNREGSTFLARVSGIGTVDIYPQSVP